MSADVSTAALNWTLNELRSACPDVKNAFIFRSQHLLGWDESTDQTTAYDALQAVLEVDRRAKGSGGLESITFSGSKRKAVFTRLNDFYLATITEGEGEPHTLNALTHVMVPTVLNALEIIQPGFAAVKEPEPVAAEEIVETEEPTSIMEKPAEDVHSPKPAIEEPQIPQDVPVDPVLPDVPVSQFMVENLSGFKMLMSHQDIVRVDCDIIAQWMQLFGNKEIVEVDIEETRTGKSTRCRFKPIKDQRLEGKGVIQLPEKVQAFLQTRKGELVVVKPVIDQS